MANTYWTGKQYVFIDFKQIDEHTYESTDVKFSNIMSRFDVTPIAASAYIARISNFNLMGNKKDIRLDMLQNACRISSYYESDIIRLFNIDLPECVPEYNQITYRIYTLDRTKRKFKINYFKENDIYDCRREFNIPPNMELIIYKRPLRQNG